MERRDLGLTPLDLSSERSEGAGARGTGLDGLFKHRISSLAVLLPTNLT